MGCGFALCEGGIVTIKYGYGMTDRCWEEIYDLNEDKVPENSMKQEIARSTLENPSPQYPENHVIKQDFSDQCHHRLASHISKVKKPGSDPVGYARLQTKPRTLSYQVSGSKYWSPHHLTLLTASILKSSHSISSTC